MKIKEICVDERPREKMLAKGADAMSNAELLAILIGSGTQKENVLEVANRLLAEGKGKLSMIADMDARRMKEIGGIGSVRYAAIAAAWGVAGVAFGWPLLTGLRRSGKVG